MGSLIRMDDCTRDRRRLDYARILICTTERNFISVNLTVSIDDDPFVIQIVEDPSTDFINYLDGKGLNTCRNDPRLDNPKWPSHSQINLQEDGGEASEKEDEEEDSEKEDDDHVGADDVDDDDDDDVEGLTLNQKKITNFKWGGGDSCFLPSQSTDPLIVAEVADRTEAYSEELINGKDCSVDSPSHISPTASADLSCNFVPNLDIPVDPIQIEALSHDPSNWAVFEAQPFFNKLGHEVTHQMNHLEASLETLEQPIINFLHKNRPQKALCLTNNPWADSHGKEKEQTKGGNKQKALIDLLPIKARKKRMLLRKANRKELRRKEAKKGKTKEGVVDFTETEEVMKEDLCNLMMEATETWRLGKHLGLSCEEPDLDVINVIKKNIQRDLENGK